MRLSVHGPGTEDGGTRSDLQPVSVSPAVLRPDGLVVKGGRGGDLVVADVTVLHAERLQAVVGVGGAGDV